MTGRAPRYGFGDTVSGVVANENDWGTSGPRIISPRRVVAGTVVGLYAAAPAVVKVQTRGGEVCCIRVTGPWRER